MIATPFHLPCERTLADYLLDPAHGFEAESHAATNRGTGTVRLDSYVRFTHRFAPGLGVVTVVVRADGSVWLTRFGRKFWRVIFESAGNRLTVAPVPAPVIVAAVRAAVEEG